MADLFPVFAPSGEPRATVLLVHGLGGHHYDTWRCSTGQLWSADETFWPLWLARDCDRLAVYVVGYGASLSRWRGKAMRIPDRATNILASLMAEPAL